MKFSEFIQTKIFHKYLCYASQSNLWSKDRKLLMKGYICALEDIFYEYCHISIWHRDIDNTLQIVDDVGNILMIFDNKTEQILSYMELSQIYQMYPSFKTYCKERIEMEG